MKHSTQRATKEPKNKILFAEDERGSDLLQICFLQSRQNYNFIQYVIYFL